MGLFTIFEDSETVTYDKSLKTIESSGNPSNEKSSFFTSPLAYAAYLFVLLGGLGGYIYYRRRKAKQDGM